MSPDEYLAAVLEAQILEDDSDELTALEERKTAVDKLLRASFPKASLTIRYGGSKAKDTLIRESYDLDLICYSLNEDSSVGETLEDIYTNVCAALTKKYSVTKKPSALRLRGDGDVDFHVDVVPGRFIDDKKEDAFLYRATGEKCRLKTNLQIHIDHVKDSGVTEAIRLGKLWRTRYAVGIRTFPLELVVISLLEKKKADGLSAQLEHVMKEFRDRIDGLSIEDPANPSGNDLSELWLSTRFDGSADREFVV